jgi:hypothetical protein
VRRHVPCDYVWQNLIADTDSSNRYCTRRRRSVITQCESTRRPRWCCIKEAKQLPVPSAPFLHFRPRQRSLLQQLQFISWLNSLYTLYAYINARQIDTSAIHTQHTNGKKDCRVRLPSVIALLEATDWPADLYTAFGREGSPCRPCTFRTQDIYLEVSFFRRAMYCVQIANWCVRNLFHLTT